MPSRADPSTTSRTDSMPARCPSTRGQVALRRPAAVAVHDDGDVLGQAVEVDLPRQRVFGGAGRHNGEDVVKRHGLGVKPR